MPAFSSSINKSGLNKRVAPKAPPRRTIRSATTPNAGSHSDGTASENQAFTATLNPQFAHATASSHTTTQQERIYHEHDSNPGARTASDAANKTSSRVPDTQTVTPLSTTDYSHPPRAPTIISTGPQQGPSSPHGEPQISDDTSAEVARTTEPAKTLRQTLAGTRSSRGISRVEARAGPAPDSSNEVTTTTGVASSASKRRRKAAREAQSALTNECVSVQTNGDAPNQQLHKGDSTAPTVHESAKNNARLGPPTSSTNHDVLIPQSHTQEIHGLQPANLASTRPKSTRKRKQRTSVQEIADEVIAEATIRVRRSKKVGRKQKRQLGSEEAENHEIVPADVKMADLVKDHGLGKTSKREAEMQKIDWLEVKRKRHEAQEEALQEEQRQKKARKNGRPLPPPGPHVAERLVLVNGQMVIDESSRVIDRNAETARDADQVENAISENHLTKRVNQLTVGRKPGTMRTYSTWDDEQTEEFYQGLRMFGTDFMMISKMFPDTSRAVIKKKFNKEEKLNPERIFAALNSKQPVDLQAYSKITDTVYEDPQDFYKELEEEEARLEAEDAKMRAEEAQTDQEIQESIEQGDAGEDTEGEQPEGGASARKNRFAADAQSIVDNAESRKKKSKKTPSAKKKHGKKGKELPTEGTEEIVGRIEDVAP